MRGITVILAVMLNGFAAPAAADFKRNQERCGSLEIYYDESMRACTRLIESGKLDAKGLAEALTKRGMSLLRKRVVRAPAIKDCSEAIELNPVYAEAFECRGVAYSNERQYERALADFTELIRLRPGYALGFFSRGNTYNLNNQEELAIEDMSEAIRLKPDLAVAFVLRGILHEKLGQQNLGIEDFKKAYALGYRNQAFIKKLKEHGALPK